jgi:hypothetical protein
MEFAAPPDDGYLVLLTKLILATAATLSFRWLPEIEYWLTEFARKVQLTGADCRRMVQHSWFDNQLPRAGDAK